MISNNDFALIAALDLNPIKTKLMHKESGEGWSLERANAIETEYRRFLYLMKAFPHVPTAPLVDVDTFWHYHILDTMKYARDCQQAFGYFVHHYPYLGLVGEDGAEEHKQAGERMRELYESTFGVSYVRPLRADGVLEAADVQTACEPVMRKAANSAWCVGPSVVKAADVRSAWCVGPSVVKAADVQSAWCVGPSVVKAADVQSAWCVGPSVVKVRDAQTAWCVGPSVVKVA
ncbi:glycine-rich domain-containing protein [Massilia jejuensis]|uniref:Glycine-rich domain-containing protein n=1 Tax=Massilia jejuensis TaxID=648894 RepID=A0ABW0PHE1_9BURK